MLERSPGTKTQGVVVRSSCFPGIMAVRWIGNNLLFCKAGAEFFYKHLVWWSMELHVSRLSCVTLLQVFDEGAGRSPGNFFFQALWSHTEMQLIWKKKNQSYYLPVIPLLFVWLTNVNKCFYDAKLQVNICLTQSSGGNLVLISESNLALSRVFLAPPFSKPSLVFLFF